MLGELRLGEARHDKASLDAAAWNERAIVLAGERRYDEALLGFLEALARRPADPDIHANLGHLLLTTGCVTEALAVYETALRIAPGSARAHFNYAAALRAAHRDEEAIGLYRAAIALQPDHLEARNNLANALAALGRLDEAAAILRDAIALAPRQPRLFYNLVHLALLETGDPALASLEAMAAAPAAFGEADRIHLHFALGKLYADLGRQAHAIDHLRRGNALRRQRIVYDEQATLALFDRIETVFTPALIQAGRYAGPPSSLPIFVVGMPRSGTSLIEQILASHPEVSGAGELRAIADAVAGLAVRDRPDLAYPEILPALVEADGLRDLAEDYLALLRGLAPSAHRIVDKMPGNFLYLGLIHLALPGARILHIRRDPVDTCLSCFMTLFAHGQDYSYDLAELGRYWRAYERVMAHWHRVLPAGTILDVGYEAVVSDFDGEIRRVLAFCGLEWDEACRDFHQTPRPVRTASAAQVRRPLYRKPKGQWRAYGELLGFDPE
jgi:tetratricopeptide (TPR) repeat protein